jgi:glyceraldehyde-3-phosphate dehydrogenase/erythrose-4-phosphate dehydrogenase
MQRKERKENGKSTTAAARVTVAFAEDMELARQYQQMLQKHQIPAAIKRQADMAQSGFSDIAIVVSEDLLDEAHALISQQAACDDFLDTAFNDPGYEEYDDDDSPYDDNDEIA